jgi:hypothetical protein
MWAIMQKFLIRDVLNYGNIFKISEYLFRELHIAMTNKIPPLREVSSKARRWVFIPTPLPTFQAGLPSRGEFSFW